MTLWESHVSKLNILDKNISFFSYNKFNLISFFDKDHGERDGSSLVEWVRKNLKDNKIEYENIKIKLLCYPRIFGYVFNPLSVFFIYNNKDELISILEELEYLGIESDEVIYGNIGLKNNKLAVFDMEI